MQSPRGQARLWDHRKTLFDLSVAICSQTAYGAGSRVAIPKGDRGGDGAVSDDGGHLKVYAEDRDAHRPVDAVPEELRRTHPRRYLQGFTVFFTGGKSTIANVLYVKSLEMSGLRVTLLDGDIVRKPTTNDR